MDWLRIGAFALLILYHVGMVFGPWGFHVKTAEPMSWVQIPMLMTNPWRLTLLFVVSGYASRALLSKSTSVGAFVRSRLARLLAPLLFGIAVIVPPQTWVEVVTQHGYDENFWHFYTHDYFRFGSMFGIVMPTWNHLWFVLYLLAYTLFLGLIASFSKTRRLQPAFDRLFAELRAIWVPLTFLLVTQFWLFHREEDTHALYNDWLAHLQYFPAFLFGFGLTGSPRVMDGLARHWAVSSGLAVVSYATIAVALIIYPDFSFPSDGVTQLFRIAREVEAWTAIAALIGIAQKFLNCDHRWRSTLAEAIFPFYIVHQTVIVIVEFWLKPFAMGPDAEFVILMVATVAGSWAFYLIGREVDWLRPLIGLRSYRRSREAY